MRLLSILGTTEAFRSVPQRNRSSVPSTKYIHGQLARGFLCLCAAAAAFLAVCWCLVHLVLQGLEVVHLQIHAKLTLTLVLVPCQL